MLKSERTFTVYIGGAPNGIAILRTDGSLLIQPDEGQKLSIDGVAEVVLEEHEKYLAWREEQGGTPGAKPTAFKVGQRVRVTNPMSGVGGATGKVLRVLPPNDIAVELDVGRMEWFGAQELKVEAEPIE